MLENSTILRSGTVETVNKSPRKRTDEKNKPKISKGNLLGQSYSIYICSRADEAYHPNCNVFTGRGSIMMCDCITLTGSLILKISVAEGVTRLPTRQCAADKNVLLKENIGTAEMR